MKRKSKVLVPSPEEHRQQMLAEAKQHEAEAEKYFDQEKFLKATETLSKALVIYQAFNPNSLDLARTLKDLGKIYFIEQNYGEATEKYLAALKIYTQACALAPNHPDIAYCHRSLGHLYYNQGNYTSAVIEYQKALMIYTTLNPKSIETLDLLRMTSHDLGDSYYAQKLYYLAIENYRKALEIYKQMPAENITPDELAFHHNNLGDAYSFARASDLAEKEYASALVMYEHKHISEPNHPEIAHCHNRLGKAFYMQQKHDSAFYHHRKALAAFLQLDQEENGQNVAICYRNLGKIHCDTNTHAAAINCYKKALDTYKKMPNQDQYQAHVLRTLDDLSGVYYHLGNYVQAQQTQQEMLKIQQQVHSSEPIHSDIAHCHRALGYTHLKLENYDQSIVEHTAALNIYNTLKNYNSVGDCHQYIGDAYSATEHHSQATEEYQEALKAYGQVKEEAPNQNGIANCHNYLGREFYMQKNYGLAKHHHEQALEAFIKLLPNPYSVNIAICHQNLAEVNLHIESPQEAINHYRQARSIYEYILFQIPPTSLESVIYLRNSYINCLNKLRDILLDQLSLSEAAEIEDRLDALQPPPVTVCTLKDAHILGSTVPPTAADTSYDIDLSGDAEAQLTFHKTTSSEGYFI